MSLIRNANFAKLFSAQVISLAGSGVTTVALALYVHHLAGPAAATAVLGQALMLRIVAFLVFSQPAGILADRMHRKRILIGTDLARAVLIGLFPFITTIWQVYLAVFAVNALTAFFTPAYEASLPEVVGEEEYVLALSWSRVAVDAEGIAGPGLAALLIAFMSVRWVFWFDAFTYVVSAALVFIVRFPPVAKKPTTEPRCGLRELTYGTRLLLKNRSIRQALLLSLAEALAGACAIVATVAYIKDVLHGTETEFSVVMACVGVGSALAAVAVSRLTREAPEHEELHSYRHRWAATSLLVGGGVLSLSVLPGVTHPPLIAFALLWVLNGAGQALVAIPSSTLVAIHTTNEERGRAFAAHFAITHAWWLLAYPVVGWLAASIGPPRTFTLCGVLCALITLSGWGIGARRAVKPATTHA